MQPPSLNWIISAVIAALAGTLFFFSTFRMSRWPYAGWVKAAFRILGPVTVLYLLLGLLVHYHPFSRAVFSALHTIQVVFLGMGLVILVLFFASGEARRGYRRMQEMKREREVMRQKTQQV